MQRSALILFVALSPATPALADESASRSVNSTVNLHDRRDALRHLPIIPVAQASEIARGRAPGAVIDAEIETNDGIRTWQVDIQTVAGRKVRLWLNANTGAFLRMVER
jgi:uncharacterized membrane protein YkoI